jgi:dihydropteroate synthase
VTVREARTGDWRIWRELRLRALAGAPDAFGEEYAEVAARDEKAWHDAVAPRPDAIRLLGERDGVPAGMMVVALEPTDARRAHVYAMWVATEARGSGIGAALVRAGLAWAHRRAALDVELRVAETQHAARRLYARCGFAPTGERRELRPGSEGQSQVLAQRLPPLVMGVVNVTPDSFSDGGDFLDPARAIAHGQALVAAGADILDIGGEATNPRAAPVPAADELRRVLPVLEGLAGCGATLSIDTTKAEVARLAIDAGASIVNDVSGGLFDPGMTAVVAGRTVTYVAGHLRGRSLAEVFAAEGAVGWQAVAAELGERLARLPSTGTVWVDPGIGFGKGADPEGNVSLLRHAGDIAATVRRPVVVGASRKRFLRRLLSLPDASLEVLDAASALASIAAVRAGAQVIRAHNVRLLNAALTQYNRK